MRPAGRGWPADGGLEPLCVNAPLQNGKQNGAEKSGHKRLHFGSSSFAALSFKTSAGKLYWEAGEAHLRSINKVELGSEALLLHAALCYADSADWET